jgi:Carboxypeptidase regulatory-like domain
MSRLTAILFSCACVSAHAASCIGPITVCSSFSANSTVFRGRVIEVIPPAVSPGIPITYPDASTEMAYSAPMSGDFRFEVLEVFKGNPGHQITVTAGPGEFRKGEEYLIFASLNPATKAIVTGICSGDRLIHDADQDSDLAWLRAYPTAPPTASIFGTVRWGYPVNEIGSVTGDVPSTTINIAGEKSFKASITAGQSYKFKDLLPGNYTLTAIVPEGFTASATDTDSFGYPEKSPIVETVAAKGCSEIDWWIRYEIHIRGAVTDSEGNPVSEAPVGLLRRSQTRTGFEIVATQMTHKDGRYDFDKVPPGDYWVAVHYLGPNNNEPYNPVYYPSGDASSLAKLIHLSPSASIENINLVQTPKLRFVSLHVHVVNPDGSPVIKAHVIASDPLTPTQAMSAIADENGDADITLCEGREYRLIASTSGYREPACAGPVKFIAKEGLQIGTLSLDKPWVECRALQRAP